MVWSCATKPTDAPVRRVERIKLGQVKRAQKKLKKLKKTWIEVIQQDIEVKALNEGILLDRNEWRKLIHVPDPT